VSRSTCATHRVLVIDHDPTRACAVWSALASPGLELDFVESGDEALRRTCAGRDRGHPFAVALIDCDLPGWDALETMAQLWREQPSLEIVLLAREFDPRWAGADSDQLTFLRKPCDAVALRQMLRTSTCKWSLARATVARLDEPCGYDVSGLGQRTESELRLAQKLEAVGQLASGIAHEINTPIQYVSDTAHFLKTACADLRQLLESYRMESALLSAAPGGLAALDRLRASEAAVDLEYLDGQIEVAMERVLDGTSRVAAIVRAMKEFAHSGSSEARPCDLNRAIENTLVVARNDYKYVADVHLELDDLPQVHCRIEELNQVFLNVVVNAAHAIREKKLPPGARGTIHVRTACRDGAVHVTVSDDGCGISAANLRRVFDPFFTTKEVGAGSGQGLAIARAVVERHGGHIDLESRLGEGTTTRIVLPVAGAALPAEDRGAAPGAASRKDAQRGLLPD